MVGRTQLATISDVQARTEVDLSTEQKARTAVLIDDIRVGVRAHARPHEPSPDTAGGVICTAVARALATPAGGGGGSGRPDLVYHAGLILGRAAGRRSRRSRFDDSPRYL